MGGLEDSLTKKRQEAALRARNKISGRGELWQTLWQTLRRQKPASEKVLRDSFHKHVFFAFLIMLPFSTLAFGASSTVDCEILGI